MEVKLAYGKTGLTVQVPTEKTNVIQPIYLPKLPDESGAILNAIRNPVGTNGLRKLVKSTQKVAISICDITRPMPSATVLPVLLRELSHVPKNQITIIIAAGTHRPNTPDEIDNIVGKEVSENYSIINHDAFDYNQLQYIDTTNDNIPIWLNRSWVESDFRITTGFVEPHFFAGFSGGPKMVAPGLAGFDTTMKLHSAKLIGDAKASWGITEGNPIHHAIKHIAFRTGVDFSVDVTINRDHKITGVYAGELFAVHKAACQSAKGIAMQKVNKPFDVVLTTNSGYPLDQNLYQAVKGMSAAAQVVKKGGIIICAAECSDGIPDHGDYSKILASKNSPEELLELINDSNYNRHDQWQVQIQAQIQTHAEVLVKSDYLTQEQVRAAHLTPIENLQECIWESLNRHGQNARICVLPEGPQTIPYLGQ